MDPKDNESNPPFLRGLGQIVHYLGHWSWGQVIAMAMNTKVT